MKCIVLVVGLLAILALAQAEDDAIEVASSDSAADSSSDSESAASSDSAADSSLDSKSAASSDSAADSSLDSESAAPSVEQQSDENERPDHLPKRIPVVKIKFGLDTGK